MRAAPREAPSLVLVLFDQKETSTGMKKRGLAYDASGVIRYLTRLELLPSPYAPPRPLIEYLLRGEDVAAFSARGFNTSSFADYARELEQDASSASHRIYPVWVHGCISVAVSPEQFGGDYDDVLALGHDFMELSGVERNRYMLVVHRDSEHIHVHFLYSRVDADGNLRERERKYPQFMAEEACAILADRHGFSLEPGHLSRVVPGGVLDLASGRITCDLNLNPNVAGCKLRHLARVKTRGDRLRTVALVAHHLADGSLDAFRSELAEHGISYRRSGSSGSEFEDADGDIRTCYEVDPRLARGKIKLSGVATDLPDESPWIEAKVARRRLELGLVEVAESDPDREWERFSAGRDLPQGGRETASEQEWCDCDLQRAFREDQRGRRVTRGAPDYWPADVAAKGAFGAAISSPRLHRAKLDPSVYQRLERPWRTEFWRAGDLIATVQSHRMTIYSKDEDDLRETLRAVHRAWGKVEIFGNSKFKKKMVKLAAELDVPISNPELQKPLAKMRSLIDTERLCREASLDHLSKPPSNPIGLAEASDRAAPNARPVSRQRHVPPLPVPAPQRQSEERASEAAVNPSRPARATGGRTGSLPQGAPSSLPGAGQPTGQPAAPVSGVGETVSIETTLAAKPGDGVQDVHMSAKLRSQRDTIKGYWRSGARYPVRLATVPGRHIFLLDPRAAGHFGLTEPDQAYPAFQDLLRSMHRQQEDEQAQII